MNTWQDDLLSTFDGTWSAQELFYKVERAAKELGFDYCAYGLRMPLPLSSPKTIMLSNYPLAWQARYQSMNYLMKDPSVAACRKSRDPVIWTDTLFAAAPDLWEEAREHGLRVGWAQSSLDGGAAGGMLTLARSDEPLTQLELSSNDIKRRWLVQIAHVAMSRVLAEQSTRHQEVQLTEREAEVLRWTADGKTSGDISEILSVSENTVNFHVKNAVAKLGTANKTAAVVKAALMGLLT